MFLRCHAKLRQINVPDKRQTFGPIRVLGFLKESLNIKLPGARLDVFHQFFRNKIEINEYPGYFVKVSLDFKSIHRLRKGRRGHKISHVAFQRKVRVVHNRSFHQKLFLKD